MRSKIGGWVRRACCSPSGFQAPGDRTKEGGEEMD